MEVDIHSKRVEMYIDDDTGYYIGGSTKCNVCEETIHIDEGIIYIDDIKHCITCAEGVRDELISHIKKYVG